MNNSTFHFAAVIPEHVNVPHADEVDPGLSECVIIRGGGLAYIHRACGGGGAAQVFGGSASAA